MTTLPKIALVGRPNVGKSTLFNRLSKKYKAIIHHLPGATRDRKQAEAELESASCIIIDTPGFEEGKENSLQASMTQQTIQAIKEAVVVCLMVDYLAGITTLDIIFANVVRKYAKQILLVANKCEKIPNFDYNYYHLGFGEPVAISAVHGIGLFELKAELANLIPHVSNSSATVSRLRICVIGKPNAGKSTFINTILDENRLVTSEVSGTTRDAIDVDWTYKQHYLTFTDTAGVRRKTKITDSLEQLSTYNSIANIKLAQIVILMIDATEGIAAQDLRLGIIALEQGKNLLLAVNKWDLVKEQAEYKRLLKQHIDQSLSQVPGIPIIYFSALKHQQVTTIIDEALKLHQIWQTKLSTPKLNKWLELAVSTHMLPRNSVGRSIKLKYIIQIGTCPPKFKIFANTKDIPDSYKRYLTNSLRQHFQLSAVPIMLHFAVSANPYAS